MEVQHLFLDTNVLLDLLSGREPFGSDAEKLFEEAQARQVRLYASGLSISTCYYILKRHHPALDGRALLGQLLPLLTNTEVSTMVIEQALRSAFADFEDGLQYFSALTVPHMQVIVTRNTKDFGPALLPVLEPAVALTLL